MYPLLAAAVDGSGLSWVGKLAVGLLLLAAAFYAMAGPKRKR